MTEQFYTTAIIPLDYDTMDMENEEKEMAKLYEEFSILADKYELEIINVDTNGFSQFIEIEVVGEQQSLSNYSYDLAHTLLPLEGENLSYIGNEDMIEKCSRDILPYE